MACSLVCLSIWHPPGAHDQILITVEHLWFSSCGSPSLMRGQVCNLLLGLTSAVILGSKSCRTHDHILLSYLRLGFSFVASYDSQGYSGSILTHLLIGYRTNQPVSQPKSESKLSYDWLSVGQCPGIRPPCRTCSQLFFHLHGKYFRTFAVFFLCSALPDERRHL
jgi:hypothetical protein